MSHLHGIMTVLKAQAEAWDRFKDEHQQLKSEFDAFAAEQRRPGARPAATEKTAQPESWLDVKSNKPIPVLEHKHRLAALERQECKTTVGRFLRGLALGGRAADARELDEERKALGISRIRAAVTPSRAASRRRGLTSCARRWC